MKQLLKTLPQYSSATHCNCCNNAVIMYWSSGGSVCDQVFEHVNNTTDAAGFQKHLIPILRAEVLRKMAKHVSNLMHENRLQEALPMAMETVKKGQAFYYPDSPAELTPFCLLSAQVLLHFRSLQKHRQHHFSIFKLFLYLSIWEQQQGLFIDQEGSSWTKHNTMCVRWLCPSA